MVSPFHALTKAKSDSKAKAALSTPGEAGMAEAVLADGRIMPVSYSVDAARPSLQLLNTSAKPDQAAANAVPLKMDNKGDLPLNARIRFALRSQSPARFPRSEKVPR